MFAAICTDPTPVNGMVNTEAFSNGQYLEGTTLSVTCNSGHLLQGVSEITCEASGTWSESPSYLSRYK